MRDLLLEMIYLYCRQIYLLLLIDHLSGKVFLVFESQAARQAEGVESGRVNGWEF